MLPALQRQLRVELTGPSENRLPALPGALRVVPDDGSPGRLA